MHAAGPALFRVQETIERTPVIRISRIENALLAGLASRHSELANAFSSLSSATVGATPDGAPVMMMSRDSSASIPESFESFEMISDTFQMSRLRSPS